MRMMLSAAALAACLVLPVAHAQDADAVDPELAAFIDSLQFRSGPMRVESAGATLALDQRFRWLEPGDARRVLEDWWGNPPDPEVLGMVVPATPPLADPRSWAVVLTYSDEGFVSDEDAAAIDYDELLADLQAGTREENDARRQMGYEAVELVGWAVPPRYDSERKSLVWAKRLDFEGTPEHTVNYDVRILGRYGYLSMNAVAGIGMLDAVRPEMDRLATMARYDEGARYADHDPSTDRIAGYGLAALLAGGVAAKTGLLGKIGALLLAAKKLLIPLLVAAAAGVTALFRRRRERAVR